MSFGPTFIGIGAPRCGTTWLYAQLRTHPDVWLSPKKELHYFDRSPEYTGPSALSETSAFKRLSSPSGWRRHHLLRSFGRLGKATLKGQRDDAHFWRRMIFGTYDDHWYKTLFPTADRYIARGEITPAYCMLSRQDAQKIHSMNPDVRLVYLMRDPIERAWSSFRYNARRNNIDLDRAEQSEILTAIKHDDADAQGGRGDYLQTLDVFGDVFDPSQILVSFYDAIEQEPMQLLSHIAEHIGVDAGAFAKLESKRVNSSRVREMPSDVRAVLAEKYHAQIEGVVARIGGRTSSWLTGEVSEGPVAHTLG